MMNKKKNFLLTKKKKKKKKKREPASFLENALHLVPASTDRQPSFHFPPLFLQSSTIIKRRRKIFLKLKNKTTTKGKESGYKPIRGPTTNSEVGGDKECNPRPYPPIFFPLGFA